MSDHLPLGSRLNNDQFVITGVLGQGGFGITYRARDEQLDRMVAIKEFFPQGCARKSGGVYPNNTMTVDEFKDSRAKFLQEARLLARFDDKSIVRVHGFFSANNTAYLVTEYLEGQTLRVLVEESGALKEQEAVEVIDKVAQALALIHEQNMIHRDVSPDNIMVCANGRVVLIDFGLAKQEVVTSSYGTRGLTRSNALGTDGYSPMEQYSRTAQVTPATDIYALGATLYYALTKNDPPSAPNRAAGETMPSLAQFKGKTKKTTIDAVEWAMKIPIAERPPNIAAFLKKLTATSVTATATSAKPKKRSSSKPQDDDEPLSTRMLPRHQAPTAPPAPSISPGFPPLPSPSPRPAQGRPPVHSPSQPSTSSSNSILAKLGGLALGALIGGAIGAYCARNYVVPQQRMVGFTGLADFLSEVMFMLFIIVCIALLFGLVYFTCCLAWGYENATYYGIFTVLMTCLLIFGVRQFSMVLAVKSEAIFLGAVIGSNIARIAMDGIHKEWNGRDD